MITDVARTLASSQIGIEDLIGASMLKAARSDRAMLPRMQVAFPQVWSNVRDQVDEPEPAPAPRTRNRNRFIDMLMHPLPLFRLR